MADPVQPLSEFHKILYTGLVSAVASTVAVLIAYLTGSKAKMKEIKLSSYYKDRIEAVKTLYGLIVELNYANIRLFDVENKEWGHHDYKSALKRWLSAYTTVYGYYSKNRILLLESNELSNAVRARLNQLSPLRNAILDESNDLESIEEQMSGYLEHWGGPVWPDTLLMRV